MATFGLDAGNNTYAQGADLVVAQRFLNDAATGTLTKIELRFLDETPNGDVRLGVYADIPGNPNKPGALILDAGIVAVADGWVEISGLSLAVILNEYYWLGYCLESTNSVRYQSGGPSSSACWSDVDSDYFDVGLPDPFPWDGGRRNESRYVMRATVEVAEGISIPVVMHHLKQQEIS